MSRWGAFVLLCVSICVSMSVGVTTGFGSSCVAAPRARRSVRPAMGPGASCTTDE